MSFKYIEYKDKKILYVDFRDKNGDENLATLEAVAEEIKQWKEKGLTLSDYHNSKASPAYMARIKQLGNEIIIPMTVKNAAIGLTPVQKILLTVFNAHCKTDGRAFDTEEEAKEWLTET
jgi:hypothetical protein